VAYNGVIWKWATGFYEFSLNFSLTIAASFWFVEFPAQAYYDVVETRDWFTTLRLIIDNSMP